MGSNSQDVFGATIPEWENPYWRNGSQIYSPKEFWEIYWGLVGFGSQNL